MGRGTRTGRPRGERGEQGRRRAESIGPFPSVSPVATLALRGSALSWRGLPDPGMPKRSVTDVVEAADHQCPRSSVVSTGIADANAQRVVARVEPNHEEQRSR